MAGAKEIRTQIRSIQNTQKITKAMEMVAASKMRRAQERMQESRPYAERIRQVIGHLAAGNPSYQHAFLQEREPRRVGFIIVSTDRGLCGGLNNNLFKVVLGEMQEWSQRGVEIEIGVLGAKAVGFFQRHGGRVVAKASSLGDTPHVSDLIGTVKVMLDSYAEGSLDRVFVAHNDFVNTMSQRPLVRQILPVEKLHEEEMLGRWDYIYEPTPEDLLDDMLMRYIEAQVYQGVVENVACEMAARMVAMKSASDNAQSIIDDLQLAYNKARQAAITRELSEIVAGASAV
ncbi:MAG TPA: F0F1 ATP synthase subunit gamma [Gammaproteobacteria bacterium]|nr:F0F1 ATP synthase subunit gamma [Gammaproteobacteria bacterium]